MIEMFTARTGEIDEIEEAIEEIRQQIDFSALKKHSGGIIFCSSDFVESGLVAALGEALPFDVIGMTTMAPADQHGQGLYDLTLTVLTSDDVSFTAAMSGAINRDNYQDEATQLYESTREQVDSDPGLILIFLPYHRELAGYELVAAMDEACHSIPMWGSITNSYKDLYDTAQTIYNGRSLHDGITMMFLNGPINPSFISASLPEHNIGTNRAIITRSEGAILREVNGQPIMDYLLNMGLNITSSIITSTPIMVYYQGASEPVALGFYTKFDDGSFLTGGHMPEGASIAVGSIDKPGIFESAEDGVSRIMALPDRQATLMLPCVTRFIMLAPDQEQELRLICGKLAESGKPFSMGYAGGEICPVPDAGGTLRNRFHNYTFSACIL